MPTLGNYTFASTGEEILSFAQLYAQTAGLDFLTVADSPLDKNAMAAQIMTKVERDITLRHPGIGAETVEVTVAANERDIDVSTDVPLMFGSRIDRLYYHLEDSPMDMTPIRVVDRLEGENRFGWDTEQYTQKVPAWAYFDRDRGLIRLQYKVPVSTTFYVAYRSGGTVYDGATLDADVSTIPTEHIDTLYLGVAKEFATLTGKTARAVELAVMQADAESRMTDAIASNLSDLISGQLDDEGFRQPLTRQHSAPTLRGTGFGYAN